MHLTSHLIIPKLTFIPSVRLYFCLCVCGGGQTGMPQTVCSGTMFTTPSGFSPHLACAEPGGEEAPQEGPGPGACLSDGPPITSASLDTLIQNLVPTAEYYPEVSRYVMLSLCWPLCTQI